MQAGRWCLIGSVQQSRHALRACSQGGHHLSSRELDIVLSWAVGGTPRADEKTFVFGSIKGVTSPTLEGPPLARTAGPPDLRIAMDRERHNADENRASRSLIWSR
jgi:hypothetical protein